MCSALTCATESDHSRKTRSSVDFAGVSTPLDWKEVQPGLDPADFNIHTIEARLKKKVAFVGGTGACSPHAR